jgi:c-di-GMP-binding flagellar brake protein YcgR
MERRKESRVDLDHEVTVTVLGEPDRLPFQAMALDMSGTGMRILSPCTVAYQAAVKVEAGEMLLLGEVIRVQASDRGIILALQLLHSLTSLGDLHRLNQALHWEARDTTPVSPKITAP